MKQITRKKFISQTTKTAMAVWALSQFPQQLLAQLPQEYKGIQLGFQTWPVKDQLSKDFGGTLKMMADMGYTVAEMCSPKGYEKIGFGALLSMKTADMRKTMTDVGISCPSCHFTFGEFEDNVLDDRIAWAKEMGLSDMVCSSFWLPKEATLDDYLKACDKLNKAAEKIKAAGMQAGFHNHKMEFAKLDGQLIYDAMLTRLDPSLVKMQFQTEVITLGYKGADYFNKFPGRFISTHLSDWTADEKQAAIGSGIIDWKEFFAAAKKAGVKYYLVEMDLDKYAASAKYIKGLS